MPPPRWTRRGRRTCPGRGHPGPPVPAPSSCARPCFGWPRRPSNAARTGSRPTRSRPTLRHGRGNLAEEGHRGGRRPSRGRAGAVVAATVRTGLGSRPRRRPSNAAALLTERTEQAADRLAGAAEDAFRRRRRHPDPRSWSPGLSSRPPRTGSAAGSSSRCECSSSTHSSNSRDRFDHLAAAAEHPEGGAGPRPDRAGSGPVPARRDRAGIPRSDAPAHRRGSPTFSDPAQRLLASFAGGLALMLRGDPEAGVTRARPGPDPGTSPNSLENDHARLPPAGSVRCGSAGADQPQRHRLQHPASTTSEHRVPWASWCRRSPSSPPAGLGG